MLKQGIVRFFLCCKQQCRHWFFSLFLITFPLLMAICSHVQQEDRDGIWIALYTPGVEESLSAKTVKTLSGLEGIFHFYLCDTQEELCEDVMTRKAECGYVLPDNLEERLLSDSYKRMIEVYTAPSTVLNAVANETVYSALVENFSPIMLEQFVKSDEMFQKSNREEAWKQIQNHYNQSLTDGSTFAFQYETLENEQIRPEFKKTGFPVVPVSVIWILLVALGSLIRAIRDRRKGFYFNGGFLPAVLAPIVLSAISVVVAILVSRG